ncbi:hypothetical protein VTK73DRAFT_2483 [Phialemonium thermophilum]|uniref:SMP domain-containing protein n=1 Tax=Phialemonium thermophilum TaxID=223376 RepID=A0ABR3Y250_9PEZI
MDTSKMTQEQPGAGSQGQKSDKEAGQKSQNHILGGAQEVFQAHKANPGPAVPENFNVAQEGTKEERRAKAREMNK